MSDNRTPGEQPEVDLDQMDDLDEPVPPGLPDPPHPINWNALTADDAEIEWFDLNEWVNWLRRCYGLPAAVIPPMWHRHWELVWELSALHTHWLGAYDPEQHGSAPIAWHADFAAARERLREWVSTSRARLDRDRPTRVTNWPGEEPVEHGTETPITDRDTDFVEFVTADVARRRLRDDAAAGGVDPTTGEVRG